MQLHFPAFFMGSQQIDDHYDFWTIFKTAMPKGTNAR